MFTLKINTDNAAFSDGNSAEETARILEVTARRLRKGFELGNLYDYYGNEVGEFELDTSKDFGED